MGTSYEINTFVKKCAKSSTLLANADALHQQKHKIRHTTLIIRPNIRYGYGSSLKLNATNHSTHRFCICNQVHPTSAHHKRLIPSSNPWVDQTHVHIWLDKVPFLYFGHKLGLNQNFRTGSSRSASLVGW